LSHDLRAAATSGQKLDGGVSDDYAFTDNEMRLLLDAVSFYISDQSFPRDGKLLGEVMDLETKLKNLIDAVPKE
jgi:hypothetical protein